MHLFLKNINQTNYSKLLYLTGLVLLFTNIANAQVKTKIDTTTIKIGEEAIFTLQVKADTTAFVVFPKGQTFKPLEVINEYPTDTTYKQQIYTLTKKYGLTQFDSGSYTVPKQKVTIGNKSFFSDSLKLEVTNVVVDTTKQGLYDIKPAFTVQKPASTWWKYALIALVFLLLIALALYWFLWRKKPLTKAKKIALLPPYERAKLALKKLDESNLLENKALKDYYSELTYIIRKYLDEKVYNQALESTTEQLINNLILLNDAKKIQLSKNDISNIENILKRADLVKFAKSEPNVELAKQDRNTVDLEIDQVKQAIPEPTEAEKLEDLKYKEALAKKAKQKKQRIIALSIPVILLATYIGFGLVYGFKNINDTLLRDKTKLQLEGKWVTSDYGFPPINIATPQVLQRQIDSTAKNTTTFSYGSPSNNFSIIVSTINAPNTAQNTEIDLNEASEKAIQYLEQNGVQDILVKREKYVTPNNAEGLKTFGTASLPSNKSNSYNEGEYTILHFTTQNIIQQIIITWNKTNSYAPKIASKIINSIELVKPDIKPEEK